MPTTRTVTRSPGVIGGDSGGSRSTPFTSGNGSAPEWESATPIAGSFEEFLAKFDEAVRGEASYPLLVFLGG